MKCGNSIAEIGGKFFSLLFWHILLFFFLRNDMFTQFLQYCKNVVKILWIWQLFFLLFHIFHNLFFFPHFRQCDCHNCQKFIPPISAMPLPQTIFFFSSHFRQWHCHNCHNCHKFFFFIFFKKWYVHPIFKIFLQQILNGRLLLLD